MKRIAAIILAWVLTVSTAVCWAIPTAYGEAEEAAPNQDSLFLKVSSITFSLVGESDDIYLGLVPIEQVTWESEDPSVVSVENGVGSTYRDREMLLDDAIAIALEEDFDDILVCYNCTNFLTDTNLPLLR